MHHERTVQEAEVMVDARGNAGAGDEGAGGRVAALDRSVVGTRAELLGRIEARLPDDAAGGGIDLEDRVLVADRREGEASDRVHVDGRPARVRGDRRGHTRSTALRARARPAVRVARAGNRCIAVADPVGHQLECPEDVAGVEVERGEAAVRAWIVVVRRDPDVHAPCFLQGLKSPWPSGPFSGTVSVRPLVQTLEVAGTSAERALCSAASSGSRDVPDTETLVTSAGVQAGSAGSLFRRQTSTSKTHAWSAASSRSQPASPSKQRHLLARLGMRRIEGRIVEPEARSRELRLAVERG